jgi:cytoskeletal protein CcmA (bactofilin family)
MRYARPRRLILTLLVASSLVGLAVGAVLAQGEALGGKLRTGDEVTIPASETVDHDLYAFGGTVIVDGTVQGDLVAAGGQVVVNGTVTGDVLAAAGTIGIGGTVAGDARLAAGQLTLAGTVAEDVLLAAGEVDVSLGAQVGQDVILAAGDVTMSGNVAGSIIGSAGTYQRTGSGSVGGTEDVTTEAAAPPPAPTAADIVADAIRHFLAVLLVGLLAFWLVPRALNGAERALRHEPLRAFVWGLGGLAGFVILVIAILVVSIVIAIALGPLGFDGLVAFVVVGAIVAIGALSVLFAFVAAYVVDAIVGLALGRLVARGSEAAAAEPRRRWARDVGMLAVGAAVVVVLTSLPVVGSLAKLLVIVLGLGTLLAVAWSARRRAPAPQPVAPTA